MHLFRKVVCMGESANVLVRVWLPDRPGALGLVASRIGAVRGDIVGIDVLERDQGVVIDEFAVRLADLDLVAVLVKEVEEVDGASVEEVRIVGRFPDPRLDALQSAATLCESPTTEALGERLVAQIRKEFLAEWSVLMRGTEVLAAEGDAPSPDQLHALATGTMASPSVAEGETGPGDLAVATLEHLSAMLLVGRDGQTFRLRERAQLFALARVADRAWQLLDPAGEPGPAPDAGGGVVQSHR
jgi:hypothetical protein